MSESTHDGPALAWRDVTITYATGVVAVDGVDLVVPRGATIGVAGESGSGKSTLVMAALRLLPRDARLEGTVELDGEDVGAMTFGRLRAVRWTSAAIVFQGAMHSLNPVRTVERQVAEALELHRDEQYPDAAARRARVLELLGLVDLPASTAGAYPHELSGGQKQRVMIALALACDPDVIIADEPTTALDVVVQAQVLRVLSGLVADRGLTLVMISHDLAVLAAVCERIVVMRDGRVVEEGLSREVLTDPQHEHTRELAAAFPVIGDESARYTVGHDRERILPTTAPALAPAERDDPGRDTADSARDRHTQGVGGAVLAVRDLVVDFRSRGRAVRAVDHVSLECAPGEIVALVGQSGSGKTTLARSILGLQRPTSGEVLFEGEPMPRDRAGLRAYRRRIQFVLQDPSASLNPKHTVYEAVAEGLRIHRLEREGVDEAARVAQALEQAELTPTERYATSLPSQLSGGQRQRVVIAGALALEPSYLVADEPVASLDASVRGEILALLLRLRRDLGLGALVITHDLGLAWNVADRVLVMHQGRIVEDGPVEEVLLDPQHDYTRSLLEVVPSRLGSHA